MYLIYSRVLLGNFNSEALKAKILLEHEVPLCFFVLFNLLPFDFFGFACCQPRSGVAGIPASLFKMLCELPGFWEAVLEDFFQYLFNF